MKRWYALYTKPHKEHHVSSVLESRGFEDSVGKRISGGSPQLVEGLVVRKLAARWGQPEQVRDSGAARWGSVPQYDVFQQSLRNLSSCHSGEEERQKEDQALLRLRSSRQTAIVEWRHRWAQATHTGIPLNPPGSEAAALEAFVAHLEAQKR